MALDRACILVCRQEAERKSKTGLAWAFETSTHLLQQAHNPQLFLNEVHHLGSKHRIYEPRGHSHSNRHRRTQWSVCSDSGDLQDADCWGGLELLCGL